MQGFSHQVKQKTFFFYTKRLLLLPIEMSDAEVSKSFFHERLPMVLRGRCARKRGCKAKSKYEILLEVMVD